jgi:signal transduction histidine kinase
LAWLSRLLRTTSFRLALLYAGVFGASVVILFGVVALSARHFMTQQIDSAVDNELAQVQSGVAGHGTDALRAEVQALAARTPGISYLLQTPTRQVLAGNIEALDPQPGVRILSWPHRTGGHIRGGIRGRGVQLADGNYLFVGLSSFELNEMQEAIARAFVVGLAVTIGLATAGGLLTSASVLRRVEAIGRTSREIMAGDLERRIALHGTGDEFDRLATSLNTMLDRIQTLMSGLQQVSSDIAHDLRTPLTRLRQRLELAYRRENTVDRLRNSLEASIRDTEAILETFGALLRIAQIESGTRKSGFSQVELGSLLDELVETYQPVTEERQQSLISRFDPDLVVRGDRELLAQLFANLIENAIRHCPSGTTIFVKATGTEHEVDAIVADDGPGVPESDRQKVLARFTRLDAGRSTPGSGLGLSLVTAIATLHDASFILQDNMPGLRCVLRLQRRPEG